MPDDTTPPFNTPRHIKRNLAVSKGLASTWKMVIDGLARYHITKEMLYAVLSNNDWRMDATVDALREKVSAIVWPEVECLLRQIPEYVIADGAPHRQMPAPQLQGHGARCYTEPLRQKPCFMCSRFFARDDLFIYIEPTHRRKVLLCRGCHRDMRGDDHRLPQGHGIVLPAQGQTRAPGSHRSGRHT